MSPRTFTRLGFVVAWMNLFAAGSAAFRGQPGFTCWYAAVFLLTLHFAHLSRRWHPPQ